MSSWGGHKLITVQAVREISSSCSSNSLAGNLAAARLPHFVTVRDLFDALNQGHWANFGQPHHFMRKFNGQSPLQAYIENVKWIHSNALLSSRQMANRIRMLSNNGRKFSVAGTQGICHAPNIHLGKHSFRKGHRVLLGLNASLQLVDWQTFGNALHALQDSFSEGHATREKSKNVNKAGAITHIKVYAGEEVKDHKEHDSKWGDKETQTFTTAGRHAVNASKDLIIAILKTAINNSAGNSSAHLSDWDNFRSKWLVASPNLSMKRDFAIDFIEQFHTGMHRGNWNIITVNMDEAGMADALIQQCGTNTFQVYSVFKRLYDHYQSDVDDVAKLYMNRVRKPGNSRISRAVSEHKNLAALLIKSMDEGYTSQDEKVNIDYLKRSLSL